MKYVVTGYNPLLKTRQEISRHVQTKEQAEALAERTGRGTAYKRVRVERVKPRQLEINFEEK